MISKAVRRVLWAAVLLWGAMAPRLHAQGAFYREVEKDGRIYVFNIAKEFALWDRYFTAEDIEALLGAHGFAVERIAADLVPRNDFTSADVLFAVCRKAGDGPARSRA